MGLKNLSVLERQVLWHIAKGKSSFKIAEETGLTPGVIRVVTDHIQDKLGDQFRRSFREVLQDTSLRPPRRSIEPVANSRERKQTDTHLRPVQARGTTEKPCPEILPQV